MFVREILKRKGHDIVVVAPGEALEFAAAKMKLEGVGALVVCEEGGKLLGVISERGIVGAVVDYGPGALQRPTSDFMDANPETCSPDDTIASVAKKMTAARVRHTPVCEAGGIAGVISIGDIVKERLEEMELERNMLRDMAAMHSVA
ncbi:MAG: CBS domain-containing protein [Rhodobacter sp.]|nr:CBS domain-containing protein [Rhodobacter sp.]